MQSWRYYIRTGKQQQKTSDDQDITALAVNTQNIMLVFELTEFFLLKTSKLWKSEKLKSKPHQWIWVSQIRHSVSVSHWEETHKDLISHSTVKKSCWSGISIPGGKTETRAFVAANHLWGSWLLSPPLHTWSEKLSLTTPELQYPFSDKSKTSITSDTSYSLTKIPLDNIKCPQYISKTYEKHLQFSLCFKWELKILAQCSEGHCCLIIVCYTRRRFFCIYTTLTDK